MITDAIAEQHETAREEGGYVCVSRHPRANKPGQKPPVWLLDLLDARMDFQRR
jgi:hypothetical protein